MVTLTAEEWVIARKFCTEAQLRVLRLHDQGMPKRAIARLLGVAPSTVRDHLDAAARKIEAKLQQAA